MPPIIRLGGQIKFFFHDFEARNQAEISAWFWSHQLNPPLPTNLTISKRHVHVRRLASGDMWAFLQLAPNSRGFLIWHWVCNYHHIFFFFFYDYFELSLGFTSDSILKWPGKRIYETRRCQRQRHQGTNQCWSELAHRRADIPLCWILTSVHSHWLIFEIETLFFKTPITYLFVLYFNLSSQFLPGTTSWQKTAPRFCLDPSICFRNLWMNLKSIFSTQFEIDDCSA